MVLKSLNGSGLHGKARSSKICRCLGQPDDAGEAVRVVGHSDGQEAQGTGLAGRGWQSQRAGTRPGLLYTDAAEGRHAILHVEEELLIEEARNIKKEVRRRGLTEQVNALLRERKFEGELIS